MYKNMKHNRYSYLKKNNNLDNDLKKQYFFEYTEFLTFDEFKNAVDEALIKKGINKVYAGTK